jgi:hypothetical protein
MLADAALMVAIGFGGLRTALALAGVMLHRSAQRQGREAEYELRFALYRLRFRCGPLRTAEAAQLRAVPDAKDETAGDHHAPPASDAPLASRDVIPIGLGSRHDH